MEQEEEAMVIEEAVQVHDVEEGEISDTASVEEISEEDFHKQDEITSTSVSTKSVDSNSNNSNSNSINSVITNGNNSNSINCNGEIKGNNNQKVWTMRDLYKYQVSRNYAPGLYNLAWAQAVQNKPLGEVLDMEYQKSGGGDKLSNADGKELERVVIDVDDDVKEEGELEEGEIDLDSDVSMEICSDSILENGGKEGVVDDGKSVVESRVELVREGFQSVTFDDAEKFEQVCSKFQNLLNSLQEIVLEDSLSEKDSLIQLCFAAIQTINSVFCSMNQDQKEQNRDFLLRSLNLVTSQKSLPFSSKQLEEVNVMISSLDLSPVSSNNTDNDVNKSNDGVGVVTKIESQVVPEKSNQGLNCSKMFDVDVIPVKFSDKGQHVSSGYLPSGVSNSRQRGVSLPLLDLHKDHDIDSLPSPTRQAPPPLPLHKAFDFGHGSLNPEWPVPKTALSMAKTPVHPYETDALKAVSSYQQKFGQASFFASNDLPSPTPSNDGNISDDDTSGEVASAPSDRNGHPVPALKIQQPPVSTVQQPPVSTVPNLGMFPGQESTNTWRSGPMTYGPVPALKSSTGKRSKDPRLRLASDETTLVGYQEHISPSVNMAPKVSPAVEIVNSRKQKIDEEPNLDGPVVKRQRSEIIIPPASKGLLALSGSGGRLQYNSLQIRESNQNLGSSGVGSRRVEHAATSIGTFSNSVSMTANQSHNLPVSSPNATTSLQSLLKDIAVNPSLLMNLVRMEQQKSAYPLKSSTQLPMSGSTIGSIPVMTMAPPKPSVPGPKDVGLLQIPTSGSIHGETPVMTMAPPRPAVPGPKDVGLLQVPSQTVQVDDSTKVRMKPRDPRRVLHGVSSQKRGSIASDQTNITSSVLRQEGQSGPGSSPHSTPPDIGQQLMKNLKNIGEIMSVSQATMSQAVASPAHSTQAKTHSTRLASEDVVVSSRPQHSWSAVEHLFDGYDDKQKAAIQKERTRRMEEQRKMFSAKKLCLVLDLDHTLLNSAKFGEVDPLHEEILRKKEEQDREKPQRHLFRSSHMSMWTKLRPGIWNFLEKASKLFELHVYTMGNKVYATEMARLLDPKGELFAGRVMSRGDDGDLSDGDERTAKSKDLEGVLGMESSVVIIDDSVRVWPHNKLNLIVVERYIYFPCSRRQFGLHGPSLLEIDHDERPEDGTLASSLAVIERIHRNFFTNQSLEEVDVRNILAAEQRRILAGCRIVFSRVFPVGEANPQLHPLWQTAEQFGAVCTTQIDEQVTHVVANSFGTDKVNWAIANGRFVVHTGWVEASALLYRRANEHDFAIKQQ